ACPTEWHLPFEAVKQIRRNPLNPWIGSVGFGTVGGRMEIPWRSTQTVRPPDRGGVEDEIILGAGVEGRGIGALGPPARQLAAGHHFEAGNVRRVAVPFPADKPRDTVAVFHAGARKQPVLVVDTDPVGAAGDRKGTACTD